MPVPTDAIAQHAHKNISFSPAIKQRICPNAAKNMPPINT